MLNREQIESEDCLPIDFIFSPLKQGAGGLRLHLLILQFQQIKKETARPIRRLSVAWTGSLDTVVCEGDAEASGEKRNVCTVWKNVLS